jgi:small nuclear ribonucleoprotein G
MEKRLFVQLNGNRKVIGILRGYDVRISSSKMGAGLANVRTNTSFLQVFMNIVLDDAVEEKADGGKDRLGMVVRSQMATSWGCGEG